MTIAADVWFVSGSTMWPHLSLARRVAVSSGRGLPIWRLIAAGGASRPALRMTPRTLVAAQAAVS